MALELYHWEPTLHSGEILLYLAERRLPYRGRFVDLLELEQHRPPFLRLNPLGQVPVLLHDGRALTETGLMLLYLEDAFSGQEPGPALTPAAPIERYEAAFWIKYSAERIAPAVSLLGWHETVRPRLREPRIEAARDSLGALPLERQQLWQKALDDAYSPEELALARESLGFACVRLENALAAGPYLAGRAYSIADIAVLFMARAMRTLLPDLLSSKRAPRTLAWLERLGERPAMAEVLAKSHSGSPERMFAPGPEPARWG